MATYFSITQLLCLLPEHLHLPTHPATHIRDKYRTYSTVQCTPYCDGRPLEASVAQPVADPSLAPNPESHPPPPPEASTKTRSKRWCLDSQLAVRPIATVSPGSDCDACSLFTAVFSWIPCGKDTGATPRSPRGSRTGVKRAWTVSALLPACNYYFLHITLLLRDF